MCTHVGADAVTSSNRHEVSNGCGGGAGVVAGRGSGRGRGRGRAPQGSVVRAGAAGCGALTWSRSPCRSALTKVKLINELNEREAALGVREAVSWHAEYKDSAWVFVGTNVRDASGGPGRAGRPRAASGKRGLPEVPSACGPLPVSIPLGLHLALLLTCGLRPSEGSSLLASAQQSRPQCTRLWVYKSLKQLQPQHPN